MLIKRDSWIRLKGKKQNKNEYYYDHHFYKQQLPLGQVSE